MWLPSMRVLTCTCVILGAIVAGEAGFLASRFMGDPSSEPAPPVRVTPTTEPASRAYVGIPTTRTRRASPAVGHVIPQRTSPTPSASPSVGPSASRSPSPSPTPSPSDTTPDCGLVGLLCGHSDPPSPSESGSTTP